MEGRFPILRQINAPLIAGAILVLVGGMSAVLKVTVDHLLYWDASATAESWARYLLQNVKDVAKIAGGAVPSQRSMDFFLGSQSVRHVFAFEIFDLKGNVQLVSDGLGIVNTRGRQHDRTAARAANLRQTVVQIRRGEPPLRPAIFSVAYVPLAVDDAPRAVVAAYIDLTEQQSHYRNQFVLAAVALSLVAGAAFCVPLVGWYRRTREKHRADERIRYLARHDALTGLFNRETLVEELSGWLVRPNRVAVHYVDLDRFKIVNDTLGHDIGDALIKAVGERLRAICGTQAMVARLGGDEFAVVQTDLAGEEDASRFAAEIVRQLKAPFAVKGYTLVVTASVGIAMVPEHTDSVERLLKCADLALYKCKAEGRDCVRVFTNDMDQEFRERLELEAIVRDGIAGERFSLDFQPIFAVKDRVLIGYEALLRLKDPAGRPIPPSTFIPLAEEIGAIDAIGAWVIREACGYAATWPEHLKVAVNLSPAQFAAGGVGAIVLAALEESALPAHRLELEITESLLMSEGDEVGEELRVLKAAGVGLVMDDFGTGYSSLGYLWRFPFDTLKIDGSFMAGLERDPAKVETVIRTIVALARALGITVTAEGVETKSQADFVREVACDQVQGFYFGRPRSAAEISAELMGRLHALCTEEASRSVAEDGAANALQRAG